MSDDDYDSRIVVDQGSYELKVGRSGEEEPNHLIRTQYAAPSTH